MVNQRRWQSFYEEAKSLIGSFNHDLIEAIDMKKKLQSTFFNFFLISVLNSQESGKRVRRMNAPDEDYHPQAVRDSCLERFRKPEHEPFLLEKASGLRNTKTNSAWYYAGIESNAVTFAWVPMIFLNRLKAGLI